MDPEALPAPKPRKILPLIFFGAGLLAGITLTLMTGIFGEAQRSLRAYTSVRLGQFLDTDILYLKTGDVLKGHVLSQDENTLWFEFPKGSAQFSMSDVKRVDKHYYTRYAKGLW